MSLANVQKELELSRQELALMQNKMKLVAEREREEQNAKMLTALQAEEAYEQAAKVYEQDERTRLARCNIVRPDTISGYNSLPIAVKVKLIAAYGSDLPREIAARERSGLDWGAWDKDVHPERIVEEKPKPRRQGFVSPVTGVTLHYDESRRQWVPGPAK